MKQRKGQSTVEYLLVVTAVTGVIILFTTGSESPFKKRLTNVLTETTSDMEHVANRFSGAF